MSVLIIEPIFVIIRFSEYLDPISFICQIAFAGVGFIIIFVILMELSKLYSLSTAYKLALVKGYSRLNSKIEQKALMREGQAYLPLRTKVGEMFYMESEAKLTILHNILNALVTMLVSVE